MKERRQIVSLIREDNAEAETAIAAPVPPFPTYLPDPYDDAEVHLRDYWRNIRKHIWLVIAITAMVTSLMWVYMARQPNIYEAQGRVQVGLENSNPALSSNKSSSVILNNSATDPAYFNTQLQILTSPALLRRVVKTLDLERNPQALFGNQRSGGVFDSLRRLAGLTPAQKNQGKTATIVEAPINNQTAGAASPEALAEAKRLDPFVRELKANLSVTPVKEDRAGYVKETRLIDVGFRHTDPQFAAKVVNTIVDVYVLTNLEKETTTNESTGSYLQKRIAELQSQIRQGEEQLIGYAKSNQILSLDASQNTVVERLSGLNRQLLEAENERKIAESSYRAAMAPGAAGALAEVDAKRTAEAETKLDALRTRRAELLVENTKEWPEVKTVEKQIGELEKQVGETRERSTSVLLKNLETRYRQSLAREQSLREAFNQQSGQTLKQNEAAVNYRILQQEIETNKSLLNDLLGRSKENDVVLAGTPNNISVIDYSIAPDVPVAPARLRRVVVAFILSLAFALSLALFLEYLNDTLRTAEDAERVLHLPVLSVIPTVGTAKRRFLSGGQALQRRDYDEYDDMLSNLKGTSQVSEAYKQLRTAILLSSPGRAPKSILVTSSVPSEGKTTTSVNIAMTLVQTGASVLLIDADMRRPRLHSIFKTPSGKGLSSYLSTEMSEAELLNMIHMHEESGLYILPCGSIPPNPAELLGSESMRRLLALVSASFNHVVIDSPPSASFTDAVLVSSLVDGVILVTHGGKTSRNIVRRTRQIIRDAGGRLLGVVLNNLQVSKHDYYYYQSYYSKDYYSAPAGE